MEEPEQFSKGEAVRVGAYKNRTGEIVNFYGSNSAVIRLDRPFKMTKGKTHEVCGDIKILGLTKIEAAKGS